MKILLPAMLAMLVCPVSLLADDNEVYYGAPDPATIKCFQVLTMLERSPQGSGQQFYTWTQGYFAGRAVSDSSVKSLPERGADRDKIFKTIVSYCEENQQSTYLSAVESLADNIILSTH